MRRKKKRFFGLIFKPMLVILVVLSFFAMLGLKNASTGVEYEISSLEKKKMSLVRDGKHLAAERAKLTSIGNIRKVSTNSEGFQFPDRKNVVYVKTLKQPAPHVASYQSSAQSKTKQNADLPYN